MLYILFVQWLKSQIKKNLKKQEADKHKTASELLQWMSFIEKNPPKQQKKLQNYKSNMLPSIVQSRFLWATSVDLFLADGPGFSSFRSWFS